MKTKLLRKVRRRFVIYKSGKGDNAIFTLHDRSFFGYCDIRFITLSRAIYFLREIIRRDYTEKINTKVWFKN